MMLRLLRRNTLPPLHQIAQAELPFLLINPISNGDVNLGTNLCPFTVSFFSSSSSSSLASNLRQESPKTKEHIVDFFHSYGFNDPQIERFIGTGKCPSFRSIDTIKPKFQHLLSFGFSPSDLVRAICCIPNILTSSLKDRIEPNLKYLETTIGSKKGIIKSINRGPYLLIESLQKRVIPNVKILRENSIPMGNIIHLFTKFPLVLERDPNVITETISKLKGLGISPSSVTFIYGMNSMVTLKKETWQRKMELFRSLGWSEKDTLSAFSRQPNFLALSDDKIKKKMIFFKEKLQWDSAMVLRRPVVLTLSLEGRIIPRCAVLNVLTNNGLWNGKPKLYGLLTMSEKDFKERFVDKYEKEVPQVIDAYQGKLDFVGFETKY